MKQNISVVLPVFIRQPTLKTTKLLERAITSVLLQDYPAEFEVLVIDDGSSVPAKELLQDESLRLNNHIRWIRLSQNKGLVNALNTGLRLAKFDLIARIDADDKWKEGKVLKQIRLFDMDPDLTIVGTGMVAINDKDNSATDYVRPGDWSGILNFFVDIGCPFPHGSVIARKSVYSLLSGYSHDLSVIHTEDFSLWGVWLRFFKPAMVEEVLYEYSISDSAISIVFEKQQRNSSELIHQTFLDLNNHDIIPDILTELADVLGLSLLETGVFCFTVWKHRLTVNVPRQAVVLLQALMPDRKIMIIKSALTDIPRGVRVHEFHCLPRKTEDAVSIECIVSK